MVKENISSKLYISMSRRSRVKETSSSRLYISMSSRLKEIVPMDYIYISMRRSSRVKRNNSSRLYTVSLCVGVVGLRVGGLIMNV
jgi:hypothetical protein